MTELKDAGLTLKVRPVIDWSGLHGELAQFLFDEFAHIVARVLHRKCPHC